LAVDFGSARSTDETLARIDTIAERALKGGSIPGLSLALSLGGETLVAKGYGFANLEHEVPVTTKTVFRIGSVTKQITGAAILQLMEAGLLEASSTLGELVDEYPEPGRRVTVHQLLNHTSGIQSYTGLPGFMGEPSRMTYSHERLIKMFCDEPLNFEPGTRFRYNNSAYYLLGVIIERVSGQDYGQYLREEIFEPLGMNSSCYGWNRPLIPHRAAGYDLDDESQLINCNYIDMSCPGAAGALCSTAQDLLAWLNGLFNWEVIADSSLERMTGPQVASMPEDANYGYGLFLGGTADDRRIHHGGGIHGFTSLVVYYPEDELAVVLLTNTGSADLGALERSLTTACRELTR
jgi:CubicO group peptidase (beta-lactamase class C family)